MQRRQTDRHERSAGRRVGDAILLGVAGLWLVTGVGTALAAGISAAIPSAGGTLRPIAGAWWGPRPWAAPDGADSLLVLSHSLPQQTLGSVVGIVVEREARNGVSFKRLIIPKDMTALLGGPPADVVQLPDGSTIVSEWTPLASYVHAYTEVPVEEQEYNPVLGASEFAEIERTHGLDLETNMFALAGSVAGESGSWMLYSVETAPHGFVLLPVEASPSGTRK